MTAGLLIGGVVVVLVLAAGIWLMQRAAAVPAARGTGRAVDPAEEAEARERNAAHEDKRSSILATDPGD